MQRAHFLGTMVATLVLGLTAAGPAAGSFVTPADLSPGDQYRLAFVTGGVITSESPDIGVYNDFVTNAANTQPDLRRLGTTWAAIASTAAVNARTNTDTDPDTAVGVPIYRLDGRRVANDYVDLWDWSLLEEIGIAEIGRHPYVWTGTRYDGTGHSGIELGADLSGGVGLIGFSGPSDHAPPRWIAYDVARIDEQYSLYGMSGTLTAPVAPIPIPAAVYLFGSALAGLMGIGWRRRAAAA